MRPITSPPSGPAQGTVSRFPFNKEFSLTFAKMALLGALLIYLIAVTLVWFNQERLLFSPSVLPADYTFKLAPDEHESTVEVDGAKLNVLQLKLPHPDGVVFFLHGNSDSLLEWFVNIERYRRLNVDVVMMDYRGFGKSTGHIANEQQLLSDATVVWNQLVGGYAPQVRRIILGRSLGTGLAAQLAAQTHPATTILVSPYFSIAELAAQRFGWFPQALLRYPLRTDAVIDQIPGNLFLLHGAQDALIAPSHSDRLTDIAKSRGKANVQEVIIAGAAHADLQDFDTYLHAIDVAILSQAR